MKEPQAVERVVDEDIEKFAEYFCGDLKNDSLSRPEISILKTYLHYKIFGPVEPA